MKQRLCLILLLMFTSLCIHAQQGLFELVERDHKDAIGAEQTMKKGTFTLILALPAQGALHKYLCYLTQQRGRTLTITLVYMEGKVSSITELKKLIQ